MATDVQSIVDTIKTGIIGLAKNSLKEYLPQAQADAQSIADAIKSNVQVWTGQLTSGEISPDDLTFLIKGKEEYLKIAALTQAGIAKVELDKFKAGVINLIVSTLTSAAKI